MRVAIGNNSFKISIKDICFFLFIYTLFDTLTKSIPFLLVCIVILGKDFITKRKKRFFSCFWWYLSVIILFLIGNLWSRYPEAYTNYIYFDLIRMIECAVILVWIPYYSKSREDIKKYILIFIMVMLLLVVKLLVMTPINEWGKERLGKTINLMPTMLGVSMAFGGTASFYLWMEDKNKRYLGLTFILFIITMLTGSRMAMITMIVGVSAFYIISRRGIKFIKNCIIVLLASLFIYYLVMNVDPLYNTIGSRFENFISKNNTEQSVQERNILKETAVDLFVQSPIWGVGTEGFRMHTYIIGLYRKTYSHNNYLEILSNYGLIGVMIYYCFLINILFKLIKSYKNSKMDCIMLIFLGMILLSDYGYVSYYGLFQQYFIAIICSLIYIKRQQYRQFKKLNKF